MNNPASFDHESGVLRPWIQQKIGRAYRLDEGVGVSRTLRTDDSAGKAGERRGESPAVISPGQRGSGAANPLVCVEGEQGRRRTWGF